MSQCEELNHCIKQTNPKNAFNIGGVVIEDIGPNANQSEILVRKCYFTWNKFGKSFGIIGGSR